MKKYNYLIVGSGLFGCVFAHEAYKAGKKCLIIEKRNEIGGNVRTDLINGINVHTYGPHIFHTKNKEIWDYINQFTEFNNFVLSPIANFKGSYFNLPFNMNTFYQLWGETSPEAVKMRINEDSKSITNITNLEEQAISMVGKDIYEKLVKEYTEKQWDRDCKELPSFIIKRLPLRFTFNNNYFNDRYQGIPIGGYTKIIEKLTEGIEILTNTDYFSNREYFDNIADKIVYTGEIDKFFDYCYGRLEYRSLRFDTETINKPNYQGNSVINFTSHDEEYTRIIEHKHFECLSEEDINKNPVTIITKEYPAKYNGENEPYYPINNDKNNNLYEQYKKLAETKKNCIFGGRLGEYKYYDMDQVIKRALEFWKKENI